MTHEELKGKAAPMGTERGVNITAPAKFHMPASAHVGGIHLRVLNLEAAVGFYGSTVGFRLVERTDSTATMTGGFEHSAVLRLTEGRDAQSRTRRSAGLFHVAFRYPGRKELSLALWRLVRARYPVGGAADHRVSDAIYLEDPDGNGVELYCDHPRDTWPRNGNELDMTTESLDVNALLEEARAEGAQAGLAPTGIVDIGHVHLQVTDLTRSEKFYAGVLGFDVMQRNIPGALFVSAGGYHHHIGLNVWNTRGGAAADEAQLGLVSVSVRIGNRTEFERLGEILAVPAGLHIALHDPDRIAVELLP
jgi:catechol 2,3-dioxygenase